MNVRSVKQGKQKMLAVDGVSKKDKQRDIWGKITEDFPVSKMLHIVWDGIRSIR